MTDEYNVDDAMKGLVPGLRLQRETSFGTVAPGNEIVPLRCAASPMVGELSSEIKIQLDPALTKAVRGREAELVEHLAVHIRELLSGARDR